MSRRFLKNTVKNLARRYGQKISVFVASNATTNYETGAITVSTTQIDALKAVILPDTYASTDELSNSLRGGNFGGFLETRKRLAILPTPLAGYTESVNNYVLVGTTRYEIKEIVDFESLWVMRLTRIEGQ